MAFLFRRASSAWLSSPCQDPDRAKRDFQLRGGEAGLSLYEYGSPVERDLILASVACGRKSDDPIDFLAIAEEIVAAIGTVVSTAGDTPLPQVNGWHRELQWRLPQLDRLAARLLELGLRGDRVPRPTVRGLLRTLSLAEIDKTQVETLRWLEGLQGGTKA